ncbi:hypothetical protein D6789_00855 [Candidatus Woesearchaeota archaeon]|nr:MAG: hypothetical protein D6789_00855 [Candidatus Woesearchaeota archaeon]
MWSYFNIIDAAFVLYFLFWFPYQPFGYLLAFILAWRIMRDFMSGRDEVVLDFKSQQSQTKPPIAHKRTILKRRTL